MAIHLLCSPKQGISGLQLSRDLGLTYKTAWFMAHRIRYAMTQEPLFTKLNGVVEADEAYFGGRLDNMHKADRERRGLEGRGPRHTAPVVTLVERGGNACVAVLNIIEGRQQWVRAPFFS